MPSKPVSAQLGRLLAVLDALPQRRQAVTTRKLFESRDWDVRRRTLERDLEDLEVLGLAERRPPLKDDLEDSRSERWHAVERNAPSRRRLTTEQAIALDLIERLAKSLLPRQIVAALQNEFEQARRHLAAQRRVDPRIGWTDKVALVSETFTRRPASVKPQVLRALQSALLKNRQVDARYRAHARGSGIRRPLEPRALVQRGPTLYLIATRPDKPGYQPVWYALHRFVSARPLQARCAGMPFNLKTHLAEGGAEFGATGERIEFKAWVSRDLKRRLLEAPLENMSLRAAKDGGAVVTARLKRSWLFERWLLGRGAELRVIEPACLRQFMVDSLRDARRAYRRPVTAP